MTPSQIDRFFATLQAANPLPASELEYTSVFELLAAVLLSAQATDASVNKATRKLFTYANTPQALLALGEDRLCEAIRTIGLYRTKARHLLQTCRILVERHGGEVPRDRASLQALPGVGRKTANVVISNAFDTPAIAVDTHVFRVSQRLGLAKAKTPEQIERQLMQVLPKKDWSEAHHLLIHHGRNLCKARNPLCERCPLQGECLYFKNLASRS